MISKNTIVSELKTIIKWFIITFFMLFLVVIVIRVFVDNVNISIALKDALFSNKDWESALATIVSL